MDRQIAEIFHDLFGVSPARCTDALSPRIWNDGTAFSHMTLVLTLEQTFGVEFSPEEMSALTSVGEIKKMLAGRGVR